MATDTPTDAPVTEADTQQPRGHASKATLHLGGPGDNKVIIDGHDVTNDIVSLQVKADASSLPTMTLEHAMVPVWIEGLDIKIEVGHSTWDMLVSLGWSPPPPYGT